MIEKGAPASWEELFEMKKNRHTQEQGEKEFFEQGMPEKMN